MHTALLRAQFESILIDVERRVSTALPSGISGLDVLTGGLPRGAISEITGPPSSGRTSIALAILAEATARDEVCALIDGRDAFDPASGESAGIDLQRLLWIRCHDIDQVFRSTDLLLQGGGFGLAVMDLTDFPQQSICAVPLSAWFRFQRVIENTPTVLLLLGNESAAKSAAALVLRVHASQPDWRGQADAPSHAVLLASTHLNVEIVRARFFSNPKSGFRNPKFATDVCRYPRS